MRGRMSVPVRRRRPWGCRSSGASPTIIGRLFRPSTGERPWSSRRRGQRSRGICRNWVRHSSGNPRRGTTARTGPSPSCGTSGHPARRAPGKTRGAGNGESRRGQIAPAGGGDMEWREPAMFQPKPSDDTTAIHMLRGDNGNSLRRGLPEYADLKMRIHRQLIERIDLSKLDAIPLDTVQFQISQITEELLAGEGTPLSRQERERIIVEVQHETFGLGPIEPLMRDATVSDILVNGAREVYVERRGRLERTAVEFRDDAHLLQIIERIVSKVGRRVDESSPMVDARLPDGSRVNAIIPPLALDGPTMSIRRFGANPLKLEDLLNFKAFTPEMAMLMEACIKARLNIVISGGTGSGKTTLLNTLSSFIPNDERIVTIEDAAELQLQQDHTVRLETRPPNIEGKGSVSTRDLVRNALRMRPERIIIGECRGGEALDMLQAMNTGHAGSMTTLHANTPRDALSRLETMVLMSGMDLPLKVVRQQISSAVDLIIQQTRLKDGSRKVTAITEVVGMEGDTVVMTDIFKFEQTGIGENGKILGELKPTGIRPIFGPRLEAAGFKLGAEIFMPSGGLGLGHRR